MSEKEPALKMKGRKVPEGTKRRVAGTKEGVEEEEEEETRREMSGSERGGRQGFAEQLSISRGLGGGLTPPKPPPSESPPPPPLK